MSDVQAVRRARVHFELAARYQVRSFSPCYLNGCPHIAVTLNNLPGLHTLILQSRLTAYWYRTIFAKRQRICRWKSRADSKEWWQRRSRCINVEARFVSRYSKCMFTKWRFTITPPQLGFPSVLLCHSSAESYLNGTTYSAIVTSPVVRVPCRR